MFAEKASIFKPYKLKRFDNKDTTYLYKPKQLKPEYYYLYNKKFEIIDVDFTTTNN